MTVVFANQMIKVCFFEEFASIDPIEEHSQANEYTACPNSKLKQ
jgi:quinol monooxygenase YgiN